MNTTPFINRSSVRRFALDYSKTNRAGKFTRVGKSFFERVDAKIRNIISSEVQSHPTVGKTLK